MTTKKVVKKKAPIVRRRRFRRILAKNECARREAMNERNERIAISMEKIALDEAQPLEHRIEAARVAASCW